MTDTTAFIQNGATAAITANSSAPTAVQIPPNFTASTPPRNQYRVVNIGSVTAFLGAGATAAIAATNAAAVTTTGNAMPIVAGAVEVFSFPPTWYFTATAASSCVLYITPGEGL
jgi:hypothetical protein